MELYPSVDLKDGQCVRLLRGDFGTVHTVAPDPVAVAESFRDAGANVLHVVDLDGAKDGVRRNAALVSAIAQAAKPAKVELGGGLRRIEDLEEADQLGVWRFVIGSAALTGPDFVKDAVKRYGGERIAVGIDAKDGRVRAHGWTKDSGRDEREFAREVASWGVQTVIYTDIAADGALAGPSFARLTALREAVPELFLVASGGVTTVEDVRALRQLGAGAAIAGKAVYTGDLPLAGAIFEARYGQLFDRAPLLPAIIQHQSTNEVLMMGYMSPESLRLTLQTKRVTFFSRTRQTLWVKGETSGNFLDVVSMSADCYHNSLLIRCNPHGPTCHTGRSNCYFNDIPLGG
ncbi:MAG: phosphoribosylformimino-5-aminoimidazole carboxamide ribotide isomerase [Oscillospiraceae bacterium]|jgi:phosphoribosylformimino-5-aminoimidazole carboxamide ribotide isomerase|nr:phosphoribosylformimino-5-aminoimidazole carboxamide ribotide isomerase [Oscillospiraceae bacterium]